MVNSFVYIEGGGESKELRARCREAFRKLFERAGFQGRLPRLVASGARNDAMRDFCTAVDQNASEFIGLLVDSEDPVANIELPLTHLKHRDLWDHPKGAVDDQVLLMVTCMETWIVADRETLRTHFGTALQETALLPLVALEGRDRHAVQNSLVHATRLCPNAYGKGKRSFEVVGELQPDTLALHLPSFVRCLRILNQYL